MKNRFRVEIYDANKFNDLTLYSDTGVDKEYLTELVISNLRNFSGAVRAYVYDRQKKKKTTALLFDEIVVEKINRVKQINTQKEIKAILA
jgi:hypothetical protein